MFVLCLKKKVQVILNHVTGTGPLVYRLGPLSVGMTGGKHNLIPLTQKKNLEISLSFLGKKGFRFLLRLLFQSKKSLNVFFYCSKGGSSLLPSFLSFFLCTRIL